MAAVIAASSGIAVHAEENVIPHTQSTELDDQTYLHVGDTGKLRLEDMFYKDEKLDVIVDWISAPDGFEVEEDGTYHALKAGIATIWYTYTYTQETIDRVSKKYPEFKDMPTIDVIHSMSVYISDLPYVFRLYNPNSGEHFYTTSKKERQYLIEKGWNAEHYNWLASKDEANPVYRLYNPNEGDHLFTIDANEYEKLPESGWIQEGVAWYTLPIGETPVYRQYNPFAKVGSHNLTTNKKEAQHLISLGWKDEGVAWYAPAQLEELERVFPADPDEQE